MKTLTFLPGLVVLSAFSAQSWAENLNDAWNIALTQDHAYLSKQQLTQANQHLVKIAEEAYYPVVDLSAGYTLLDNAPASKMGAMEVEVGEEKVLAYAAKVSVPLYTHGRFNAAIDQAQFQYHQAQADESAEVQALKLKVAQAYIQVLNAQKTLQLAEQQQANFKAHLADVQNMYTENLVDRNDLLSAKVSLVDAEQQNLQAQNGLALAKAAYNRLLGRPLDQAVQLDELQIQLAEQQPDMELAQKERAEVQSLQAAQMAVRSEAKKVQGADGPQINLSAGYDYQQNKYQVHEGQWSATVAANWRIFDGGINKQRADSLRKQANSLQQNLLETQSQIRLQIHQAWLKLKEAKSRIEVTQIAVDQAEENLKITRERYLAGLSKNTEVLDATTLKMQSDTHYFQAVYDAQLAHYQLQNALGKL